MTSKTLFDYSGYKAYLAARLNESGARSGKRAALAKALDCQSSFVSQVLHGDLDLSLEQAWKANAFLEHDSAHSHFFMLLVQKERAGTADLRRYIQVQIEAALSERNKMKNRLGKTRELTDDLKATYYSHSDYITIHMAIGVPKLRTAASLAQSLHLPAKRVEAVLDFLLKAGLVRLEGSEYQVGPTHMHLGSDSPFIQQHHTNWRLEGLRRLNSADSNHLHYSGVYTISREDFTKLRENLMRAIQKGLEIVKPSPEEMLVAQIIDLVPLES